ncbi:thiopeptide-type bacteriocin biosynthesis protein [Micromonospora marina]|uniref:Thiopeptide-type bacteriocin biosynthesis domain-containing protein n=1 Tax=Micromonospora marina TaxID=307120 RepID=A0A1C5ALN0_9ACTN|nr:thiopeptide-type bacteriocin biosynthesis protein [Micromonospora marina]SCF46140.1 thiopeptide-type bacteriocin biosynthesis domain-containing protein [Micromonospora marina]
MDHTPWHQINISYPGQTAREREQQAVTHLSRVLPAAETAGLITSWWFIRKGAWRIRYLPTDSPDSGDQARWLITEGATWTGDIYEPETHAFGGGESMTTAHTLFHHDSHHLLTYLHQHPDTRREHSLILCTALMRAAGLDLIEQGDVWAQVVEHRAAHLNQALATDARRWERFTGDVRTLLLGAPRTTGGWHTAFANAGAALHRQREEGTLTRGLRAVIALHVIFHWNRLGLPATTQATLARAAQEAIFGRPDTHPPGLG